MISGSVGDNEPEAKDSAGHCSHRGEDTTHSDALRPAGVNVGVESHDDPRSIHRQHRRRYLSGIHQVVSAPTHVDGAPELAEKSALRLPGDAVREPPLHLETFLPLHPRIDRGEDIALSSPERFSSRWRTGSGDLRDQSPLLGHIDSGSLFRERLVQRRSAQPDLGFLCREAGSRSGDRRIPESRPRPAAPPARASTRSSACRSSSVWRAGVRGREVEPSRRACRIISA